MNAQSTYAFYGSLRQGMSNYQKYASALRFLYQEVIPGYALYEMSHYPYAFKTGSPDDLLTVEVYEIIDPATEQAIHNLEISVGYYYDEVDIHGKSVGIYLFKDRGPERLVKEGDWVKFFGI